MSVATNSTLSVPPAGDRILICEDDPLIALGWSGLLIDEGYTLSGRSLRSWFTCSGHFGPNIIEAFSRKAYYTVVGPAYRAEKALEMAYRHLPTLALIDFDRNRPL
jgi:two-component system, response regulator PdtaR